MENCTEKKGPGSAKKRILAVAQQTMLKEKIKGYLALCRAGTVEDSVNKKTPDLEGIKISVYSGKPGKVKMVP